MLASQNSHSQVVELLLSKQADSDSSYKHIMKALVAACYDGHSTLINTLLHKIPVSDLPHKRFFQEYCNLQYVNSVPMRSCN